MSKIEQSLTSRGFAVVTAPHYPSGRPTRLLQESSIVGDYEDAFDNPGSSALWVGEDHHLNREEVRELALLLMYWLENKTLRTEVGK